MKVTAGELNQVEKIAAILQPPPRPVSNIARTSPPPAYGRARQPSRFPWSLYVAVAATPDSRLKAHRLPIIRTLALLTSLRGSLTWSLRPQF
jgi:hypothetical protein